MNNSSVVGIVTAVYLGLGLLFSIYPPYVQDKGLARICIMTTAICLWSLWLLCYLSQMNPMTAPEIQPMESND